MSLKLAQHLNQIIRAKIDKIKWSVFKCQAIGHDSQECLMSIAHSTLHSETTTFYTPPLDFSTRCNSLRAIINFRPIVTIVCSRIECDLSSSLRIIKMISFKDVNYFSSSAEFNGYICIIILLSTFIQYELEMMH